jgi:hypothetical protein
MFSWVIRVVHFHAVPERIGRPSILVILACQLKVELDGNENFDDGTKS